MCAAVSICLSISWCSLLGSVVLLCLSPVSSDVSALPHMLSKCFRASWHICQVPRWRRERLGATAHVRPVHDPGGHDCLFKKLRDVISDASSFLSISDAAINSAISSASPLTLPPWGKCFSLPLVPLFVCLHVYTCLYPSRISQLSFLWRPLPQQFTISPIDKGGDVHGK